MSELKSNNKVSIVLLNWNNSKDTINCLKSIFKNTYKKYDIILCDNGSDDDSVQNISSFLESSQLSISENNQSQIEYNLSSISECNDSKIVFLKNKHNLGFSGGNNIALKYLMCQNATDYVWLLNIDTEIASDSIEKQVKYYTMNPNISFLGSKILDYSQRDSIQCFGGGYVTPFLRTSSFIKNSKEEINYIAGASVFISLSTLKEVDLMDETFFLYYEDIDWSFRASKISPLAVCEESIVYHKEGGTIGSSSDPKHKEKSLTADIHGLRSRILFLKKYNTLYIIAAFIILIAVLLNRIKRGQLNRAFILIKIFLTALVTKLK